MKYRITVEDISSENEVSAEKIEFEAETHENLLEIVKKLEEHSDFEKSDAAAFGVGLKLFSGVMLKYKTLELFREFKPHFKDFMVGLKSSFKG